MTATIRSATVFGIEPVPIWIEVDIARGLPHFSIVGLPDSGVRESRDRVRAALRNAGYSFPVARITVNLAPSDLRKAGSSFDLPIALGILAAQGVIPQKALSPWVVLGELALDGQVRPVRGALCIATLLLNSPESKERLMLPAANAHEVAMLPSVEAVPIHSLRQAVSALTGSHPPPKLRRPAGSVQSPSQTPVITDPVIGQEAAKRALAVALAGGHSVLMIGPPGSGKSLLGERMIHLLPPLTETEAVEVNRVYSAAGLLDSAASLLTLPPVRMPHHTITTRAMIGGGNPPLPGELSLAHRGILLLDEMAHFRRAALDALREPLEQGFVRISRDGVTTLLPGRVSLIGATNPCPCGWLGDPRNRCMCAPAEIARYRKKISGPLLDRMDMVVEVARTPFDDPTVLELQAEPNGEPLRSVRTRIEKARSLQRMRNPNGELNGFQRVDLAHALGTLPPTSKGLLSRICDRYALSGRGVARLLRVARTIADLSGSEAIESMHLAEAAAYRMPPEYLHGEGA